MEDNESDVPVPLPRNKVVSRTPVPLPRKQVNVEKEESHSSQSKESLKTGSTSNLLHHTNSIRKSLRRVTSNVQEKSSAVFVTAKNVSSKMETSVRNILAKRHTVVGIGDAKSDDEDSEVYVRCQSLPPDDIFRSIRFDSPLTRAEDDEYTVLSDPPPYPPPPLPDESIYDEIHSTITNDSSHSIPEGDTNDLSSVYEELSAFTGLSEARSSVASSSDESRLHRSDSWNYYDIPLTVAKPRGNSYENVAIDYLPYGSSQNIYSDEPAKNKIDKKPIVLPPSDTDSVISAISSPRYYENWSPSEVPLRIRNPRSSKPTTKSVIYEFDPLFAERAAIQERAKKEAFLKKIASESKRETDKHNDLHKSASAACHLEMLTEVSEDPEGEYFLYQKTAVNLLGTEEMPKEIPVLTQGKKKTSLARWSSMKRAIKMVTDSASWSPVTMRKNQRKDETHKVSTAMTLHNGYLLKSPSCGDKPKDFVQKWCQLLDGKLIITTDKNGNGKETIPLESILSIQLVLEQKPSGEGDPVHCFELSTSGRTKCHMFGSASSTEARLWMRTLIESLTNAFSSSLTADFTRSGQCFLKEGVSSDWCSAWILLGKRKLQYYQVHGKPKELDLRMARCIVLAKDEEGRCQESTEGGPYIKVISVDQVIYLQMDTVRETNLWLVCIRGSALDNGTSLEDQQLTKDYVPVIVDKCINFVYAHGSMSEGIYRRSGSNSKVTALLSLLRTDAWAVQMSRAEYTEYDVSSVLKRFFRDLPEPLLSNNLHKYFCQASHLKCTKGEKESAYRSYLEKLPQINYVTLRRLIGHLQFVHEQADKNKMPVDNLAAIWAPTLMHVEGKDGMEWSKRECEVVSDLILNYKAMFLVEDEESVRENRIKEALERVHVSPNTLPPAKPSGELKVSIYIGSRKGESVTIPIGPGDESGKVCSQLAGRTDFAAHELCLSEVVVGGTLSRPLHHKEAVLNTVLKWAYWDSADSKDNYLLLASNSLYREIAPLAKPPLSKCGELKFADTKTKAFKSFIFEFSQAKLSYYKDKACSIKLDEWKIEDVIWYIGHEPKRNPSSRWAITFIDTNNAPKRTKECPYFGCTIAGSSREDHLQWMAAMLLGQFQHTDLLPRQQLI